MTLTNLAVLNDLYLRSERVLEISPEKITKPRNLKEGAENIKDYDASNMHTNSELHHPTTLHTSLKPSIYSDTKQKSNYTGGMINYRIPAHMTGWNRYKMAILNTLTHTLWSK